MKATIRTVLLATAFAATVAGTLTGASLRGETTESPFAVNCTTAVWPKIPAACLNGGASHDVRYVTTDMSDMERRFAVAFQ
jgi:hypothetical protein